jgi:hypothetical protein
MHVNKFSRTRVGNRWNYFLLLLSLHELFHAHNSCEHIHNQTGRIKAHGFLAARPSAVRLSTPALLRIML